MILFISAFAPKIDAMLSHRESYGLSRSPCAHILSQFDRFCAKYFPNLSNLNREVVIQWINFESLGKCNNLQKKAVAIRQFGKYLDSLGEEAYVLPNNYISSKSSFIPYVFTDSDLQALFRVVDQFRSKCKFPYISEILPVLLRLLYTCGLRPGEGLGIKCHNINLNTGEILITHNKQKRERVVVMSDDMLVLCRQYNTRRNIFGNASEFFFPTINGGAYNTKQLRELFRECWRKANPDKANTELPNVRPYDLRHRFATATLHRWLDEGRNLYAMLPYLRAYMGHETFSSTAYYIHLLPEKLVRSSGIDWSSFDLMFSEVRQ